jgi:hypothetical protein
MLVPKLRATTIFLYDW